MHVALHNYMHQPVYTCGSVYVCVHLCASSVSHSIVGSGKTLAYLAPVMHQLKHEEETIGMMARVNRPRAIILCPSRELASQVLVSILTLICDRACENQPSEC